jgi:quercetin dioxygenase-like cupin family protein
MWRADELEERWARVVSIKRMPFSTSTTKAGVIAGPAHGLQRLIVQVQAVAPGEIGYLHRHDSADQILRVLQGDVLMEVGDDAMVCGPGEIAIVPAGRAHGFRGLEVPALLEVFGEQRCGTFFPLAGDDEVEVHRPEVPWDRPGPPTDMAALVPRMLAPRQR